MTELCCGYLSVWCIWLDVIIMSRTSFRVNLNSIVWLNIKKLLARIRRHIWSLNDINEIRTQNHLVCKRTLNHLAKLVKWLSCVVSNYLSGAFWLHVIVMKCVVSEWIYTTECRLSVLTALLNHLSILAKWLSVF